MLLNTIFKDFVRVQSASGILWNKIIQVQAGIIVRMRQTNC